MLNNSKQLLDLWQFFCQCRLLLQNLTFNQVYGIWKRWNVLLNCTYNFARFRIAEFKLRNAASSLCKQYNFLPKCKFLIQVKVAKLLHYLLNLNFYLAKRKLPFFYRHYSRFVSLRKEECYQRVLQIRLKWKKRILFIDFVGSQTRFEFSRLFSIFQ